MGLKLKKRKLQQVEISLNQSEASKFTFDMVLFGFLLNENRQCPSTDSVVFYGNHTNTSDSVHLTADRCQLNLHLHKVPDNIHAIEIVLSIYDAEYHKQTFRDVTEYSLTVKNVETDRLLQSFDPTVLQNGHTYIIGTIHKMDDSWQWMINPRPSSSHTSIKQLCSDFSLSVEESP